MKYDITKLDAVRSFFAEEGYTGRIRFYNDGKEVPKDQATEFSVSPTAPVYIEQVVEAEAIPADAETVAIVKTKSGISRKLPSSRKGEETKAQVVRAEIIARREADNYDFEELVSWSRERFGWERQNARAYINKATARVIALGH